MLNDTEKGRIRLEEFYRNEIRESISASKGSPIWTFLNSTFGVWLLSALFVSGIGAAYTKYQENSADRRRTQEATERLDLELGYRFSQIQVHLSQASLVPEPERETKTRAAIHELTTKPSGNYQNLFPEYATFSIPTLVAELRRHETSGQSRKELEQILAHLAGLPTFFEAKKAPLSNPTMIAGAIVNDLVLHRWKDAYWYFLDGSKEQPFP